MAFRTTISVFLFLVFAMIFSEGRPSTNSYKSKRTVQMVERKEHLDGHGRSFHENSLDDPLFGTRKYKSEAMRELLGVLGLKAPTNLEQIALREKSKKPPKYMVDLYKAIADDNGISRAPGLLDADTVRSIPNTDPRAPKLCKFDLSSLTKEEQILDAELHLFQSRKTMNDLNLKESTSTRSCKTCGSTYFVKIYQLLSSGNPVNFTKKLISMRRLHSIHSGWHIFPILPTVERWLTNKTTNFGLYTEVITTKGQMIENSNERESLKPILVVFTNNSQQLKADSILLDQKGQLDSDDIEDTDNEHYDKDLHVGKRQKRSTERTETRKEGKQKKSNRNKSKNRHSKTTKMSTESVEPKTHPGDDITVEEYAFTFGQKRNYQEWESDFSIKTDEDSFDYISDGSSKPKDKVGDLTPPGSNTPYPGKPYSAFSSLANPSTTRSCRRYPLYVDFEEMGWSGWIIHPQGYNAYHCRGACSFPLGQNLNPSNHATVQSIMHTLGLGNQPVEMPCCAPDKLYDINLLYFDQNDYVVLRRYKDMVAASCACR